MAIAGDGSTSTVEPEGWRQWHVPRNEKEFHRSPQKAIWRNARELRMDKYADGDKFRLVARGSLEVEQGIWVHVIKEGVNNTFGKADARYCIRGDRMDDEELPSINETAQWSSCALLFGLRTLPFTYDFQIDQSDAFQNTRIDGTDAKVKCTKKRHVWSNLLDS